MKLVVLGLSLSSSWGNGHATTFRALLKAFAARGHEILFLERDVPWYRNNGDIADPDYCRLEFYGSLEELRHWSEEIRSADAVVVGSYVPEGVEVGRLVQRLARGVRAFYDIDTPVTLARLRGGADTYVAPGQIPRFEAYLSFTGGPTLGVLERAFGAKRAAPLYCAADVDRYRSTGEAPVWDLGYLGTYSPDRQPMLERLLIEPARQLPERRFVVAGPQYPDTVAWPANVERIEHLPPDAHASFYSRQRFTLNVTRSDMIAAGWSPSVRLFEAAACGTPIISDAWEGLTELLPGGILMATQSQQVTGALTRMPEAERLALAASARASVLSAHSGRVRADELAALLRSGSRRRHDKSAPTKPIAHQLDGAFRS